MSNDIGKTLGILASIAAIIGTCIAAIALIPAFGSWIDPRDPIRYVTPSDNNPPDTSSNPPTAYVPDNPTAVPQEPVVIPTNSSTPRIYNFTACKEPCNGGNSTTTFPSAITKVYLEWDYENIPYGSSYIRTWTMNGKEWIKYDCSWTGSENGRDSVKLTEPKGLHSGTWELTIVVNGTVLLSEQINVSGNWNYWDPAGTLNSCYGTTN